MTCSSVQLTTEESWLLCVTIAGSVLLKQRNPQMNATASVLGGMNDYRNLNSVPRSVFLISGSKKKEDKSSWLK